MADSSAPSPPEWPRTASYETDALDEALTAVLATRDARTGTCLVFHGGTREERQQALTLVTRHVTGTVHQFEVPSLLAERRMQTQNSLRKAFDHAAEEDALLFFDRADALFTHRHPDAPDADTAPTTLEYVFDRMEAFGGTIVLGLDRERHVERAMDLTHLIVEFG